MRHTIRTRLIGFSASMGSGNVGAFHAIAALTIMAVAAACHSPTQPTPPGLKQGTQQVYAIVLTIAGPTTVAPGQTVAYTATAKMSDGSTADYTQKVAWNASPSSVLTISTTGQATGQSGGDATLRASATQVTGTSCCSATLRVIVLPPGTYRLVGKVLESGLPVVNASVVVLSGIGAGLSATTDDGGGYRLYGVGGPIQVKFSKPGYDPIVKTFTATQNDVLDFPEAHQTAAIPPLAGAYTLTLTADPTCPETPAGSIGPLDDSLRAPRAYAASLAQNGPTVTVTLSDPSILAHDNQFSGRVTPDGIDFTIGYASSGYYYYYGPALSDGVSDQLSATQVLTMGGSVHVPRSASTFTGSLNGPFEVFGTVPYTKLLQKCVSPNHRFALTKSAAQPSRHR